MAQDNTDDKTRALDKIRALIARTKSSSEEEARTSAMLAIQMMEKYGLMPDNTTLTTDELERLVIVSRAEGALEYLREIGSRGGRTRRQRLSKDERADIASLGGYARSSKLTQKERSEIASRAGKASGEARRRARGY